MNTTRLRGVIGVAVAALVLSGCAPAQDPDNEAAKKVKVDTPKLRTMRAEAKVEQCQPGKKAGASKLPALTLPCLGGGKDVDLSTLKGPLLINVWASWCAPCRREMPILQQFHRKYAATVPVLGINFQDKFPDAALDLVRETGVTYPLLADPASTIRGADPIPAFQGIPLQVVVDAEGEVHPVNKEVTSLKQLEDLVGQYVDLPSGGGRR